MSYGYRQYRDTAHRWTQIGVGLISVIAGLILIVCVTAPMYVSSMLKDAGLSAAISHRLMEQAIEPAVRGYLKSPKETDSIDTDE